MIRSSLRALVLPGLAGALLAGCATGYSYRSGPGDYYYGQPQVEYRDYGMYGYGPGWGWYGAPYPYYWGGYPYGPYWGPPYWVHRHVVRPPTPITPPPPGHAPGPRPGDLTGDRTDRPPPPGRVYRPVSRPTPRQPMSGTAEREPHRKITP
jgi:hypothetical protein